MKRISRLTACVAIGAVMGLISTAPGMAAGQAPYDGMRVAKTPFAYTALIGRLDRAVRANKMGLVARASATLGAKSLGIAIPGNMVVGVFAPRFAVQMLKADVPAGIHAPIRFYITENRDGTASLSYRKPSAIFAPYDNRALDAMASELDAIFAGIVRDVLKGG
jgi:uncharacterized protein (DUF302 family)